MESSIKSTNLAGVQYFNLDSGSYYYTIEKPGFFQVDSSLHFFSDTVVQISMQSTMADVKFRIKELEDPVAYARVSLNGDTMQTNYVGLVVFSDLMVYENYSYSVGKEGYETVSGNFYLALDTTINMQLDALTYVNEYNGIPLYVYPVPAEDYFVLESGEEMTEIRLLDLNGRLLLSERVQGRYVRKELPSGIPPIYLLKVTYKDGTISTKRMVRI
jgi:hypothetical protein